METSAIIKAAALKSDVIRVTIGPNSSCEELSGSENETSTRSSVYIFTSTPNHNSSTKNDVNGETQLNHRCSVSEIKSIHNDGVGINISDSKARSRTSSYQTSLNESSEKRLSDVEVSSVQYCSNIEYYSSSKYCVTL